MRPATIPLLAVLLLGSAHGLPLPLEAPAVLQGPVASDATYEGGGVLVAGDVEVTAGATLTLRQAATTVLALEDRPIAITVRPGAALVVEGGTLRSIGAAFDVLAEPGGTLTLYGPEVRDARIALEGMGTITDAALDLSAGGLVVDGGALVVRGGVLEASPDALVHVLGGSADVEGAELRDAGAEALRAEPGTSVRLAASRIAGATAYGVSLWGASAILDGNDFASALDYAVRADDTHLLFRGNNVTNHCAVFLNDGSTGTVEGNTLVITNHGITVRDSGAVRVANNTVRGGTQGIAVVDSTRGVVENNTVEQNNIGLLVRRGGADVTGNTFRDNDGGVFVTDEPADLVVLRDNAFGAHPGYAVRNDRAAAQDARWNWWGSPLGPGGVAGAWLTSPWLAAPP